MGASIIVPERASVYVQSWADAFTSPADHVELEVLEPIVESHGDLGNFPGTGKRDLGIWNAGTEVLLRTDGLFLSTGPNAIVTAYPYPPGPPPDRHGNRPPVPGTIDDPSWVVEWETAGGSDWNDHYSYVWIEPRGQAGFLVGASAI